MYNADEEGFNEGFDAMKNYVIVPCDFPEKRIDVPVSKAATCTSMIACIAADGHALQPMVIVMRKVIEIELYQSGYIPVLHRYAR
jgi:hypothetical protein